MKIEEKKLFQIILEETEKYLEELEESEELEEESNIQEKAVSKSQQQAAGAAYAAKSGKMPPSQLKGASKQMYKMSKSELEKFAGTSHKGLPDKKKS